MKIILSRKGFDSTYGGIESPVFENDKSFISLPIPARNTENSKQHGYSITYQNLNLAGHNYGKLIDDLFLPKRKKHTKDTMVHLDPDIVKGVYPNRDPDWLPLFGQDQNAQAHLRNQKVGKGDIFLFFGLYRWV